jgi:hypothetical protein
MLLVSNLWSALPVGSPDQDTHAGGAGHTAGAHTPDPMAYTTGAHFTGLRKQSCGSGGPSRPDPATVGRDTHAGGARQPLSRP